MYEGLTDEEVKAVDREVNDAGQSHSPPALVYGPNVAGYGHPLGDSQGKRPASELNAGHRYSQLSARPILLISAISFYEVFRETAPRILGPSACRTTPLTCADESDVLPVSIPVLKRAADLWVDAAPGWLSASRCRTSLSPRPRMETHRVWVTGRPGLTFAWIPRLLLADWRTVNC